MRIPAKHFALPSSHDPTYRPSVNASYSLPPKDRPAPLLFLSVSPMFITETAEGVEKHLSPILGILCLYSVDAVISVHHSKMMVGDTSI